MSIASTADTPIPAQAQGRLFDRPSRVILFGVLLALVLSWPRLLVIWRDDTFFDTDDAMRLVQVRNWLAGQGWFDLVEHRLFPPAGLLMHWSRVVDVPLALLIRLFELGTSPALAERLARIVFPLALQLGLVAAAVEVGAVLAGPRAMLPSMALVLLSGFMFEQFPPGRIDHHAPQITLLLAMAGLVLSSLAPGRARHAGWAGLCLAVSLAISLENLPFLAVILAVLPLVWLVDPALGRAPLGWLAASLGLAVPAVFVATIPPWRYADRVCDAFSAAHLSGFAVGAGGLCILWLLTPRLTRPWQRLAGLALVGTLALGALLAANPSCLHDPYAGMDPLLVSLWLRHVTEAQPLLVASRLRPDTFTMLFCPLLVGAGGLVAAVWLTHGVARLRWAAMLALTLVGMAGTMWEIRVAASAQPLALMGGVFVVVRLLERSRDAVRTAVLVTLAALPFSTIAWSVVPIGEGDRDAAAQLERGQACRAMASLTPLAALPPGLDFAPIDDGSHLLVATGLQVVAAPYHRNQTGNRTVLEGFLAPPEQAEGIVRKAGARYVSLCPGEVESTLLSREAPTGLAARLLAGDVPAWLAPVPLADTPIRVFAVK